MARLPHCHSSGTFDVRCLCAGVADGSGPDQKHRCRVSSTTPSPHPKEPRKRGTARAAPKSFIQWQAELYAAIGAQRSKKVPYDVPQRKETCGLRAAARSPLPIPLPTVAILSLEGRVLVESVGSCRGSGDMVAEERHKVTSRRRSEAYRVGHTFLRGNRSEARASKIYGEIRFGSQRSEGQVVTILQGPWFTPWQRAWRLEKRGSCAVFGANPGGTTTARIRCSTGASPSGPYFNNITITVRYRSPKCLQYPWSELRFKHTRCCDRVSNTRDDDHLRIFVGLRHNTKDSLRTQPATQTAIPSQRVPGGMYTAVS